MLPWLEPGEWESGLLGSAPGSKGDLGSFSFGLTCLYVAPIAVVAECLSVPTSASDGWMCEEGTLCVCSSLVVVEVSAVPLIDRGVQTGSSQLQLPSAQGAAVFAVCVSQGILNNACNYPLLLKWRRSLQGLHFPPGSASPGAKWHCRETPIAISLGAAWGVPRSCLDWAHPGLPLVDSSQQPKGKS